MPVREGSRSASFCLGVLESLAKSRMLRQFDYLSTVSGGGFIGGWLQVLIRDAGGVASAEEMLSKPNPDAVRRLRAYTNYLTPQTGGAINRYVGRCGFVFAQPYYKLGHIHALILASGLGANIL